MIKSRPQSMPIQGYASNAPFTGRRKTSKSGASPSQDDKPAAAPSPARKRNTLATTAPTTSRSSTQETRRPYTYAELQQQPFFANNAISYSTTHSTLGALLVQVALDTSTQRGLYGAVICAAGVRCYAQLDPTDPQGHFRTLRDPLLRGAAVLLHAYTLHMPTPQRQRVALSPRADRVAARHLDLSASSMCRIAAGLERIKLPQVSASIASFLAPTISRAIEVDLILKPGSSLSTGLFPTPHRKASTAAALEAELARFPQPAKQENSEKRGNLLNELLTTERTYNARLTHLLKDYAMPLRAAARKEKALLGAYEVNLLFPSALDAICLLNADFLKQLEAAQHDDYAFALALVNGFRDFRKVYGRYLELSADLDTCLRQSLKLAKFKDWSDSVRNEGKQPVGIRELVKEPVSRIPRYALLITSLLAVLTPQNPAYGVFKEALTLVRRIGLMGREEGALSQEQVIKLSTLVSSWPTELVRSHVEVRALVDCLDVVPWQKKSPTSHTDGTPCALVLLADKLVILKRSRTARIDDVLASNRKGELGFRGWIALDKVALLDEADTLTLVLSEEMQHVNSEHWLDRPLRKFVLLKSDAVQFSTALRELKDALKTCPATSVEVVAGREYRYARYMPADWQAEQPARKHAVRIFEDIDDGDMHSVNLVISKDSQTSYSAWTRRGPSQSLLCSDVSAADLKQVLFERLDSLQQANWLDTDFYPADAVFAIHSMFATSLACLQASGVLQKSRPSSPTKLMASFLGLRSDREASPTRPATATAATATGLRRPNTAMPADKDLAGIAAFVEALSALEHFTRDDFTRASSKEMKEIASLSALIAKDPSKAFAIRGSPAKIAAQAFHRHLKLVAAKKVGGSGVLVPEQSCAEWRSVLTLDTESRMDAARKAMQHLPAAAQDLLRTLLMYGSHVLAYCDDDARVPFVLVLSELLVPSLHVTSFVAPLQYLLAHVDMLYRQPGNFDSVSSTMTMMPSRPESQRVATALMSPMTDAPPKRPGNVRTDSAPAGSSIYTPLLSHFSLSPAKDSFNQTPELVEESSNADESDHKRSPSLSSLMSYAASDVEPRSQRRTRASQHEGMQLPYSLMHDKALPVTPLLDELLRSPLGTHQFEASPPLTGYVDAKRTTPLTMRKVSASQPLGAAFDQSKQDAYTASEGLGLLSSRKGASIPRLPSTLVRRRESQPLSKQFSGHAFTFDLAGADDDLSAAIQYASQVNFARSVTPPRVLESKAAQVAVEAVEEAVVQEAGVRAVRRASRDHVQRERQLSTLSIRRPSAASSNTSDVLFAPVHYGPSAGPSASRVLSGDRSVVCIPTPVQEEREFVTPLPTPTMEEAITVVERVSIETTPALEAAETVLEEEEEEKDVACTSACQDHVELLGLELQRYKDLYRDCCEEVDVTIDSANEEIAALRQAYASGSVERTALAQLELEKAENGKLRRELHALKERLG
ncbi:hypothetical protein BCR37DRAFT_393207 [Protomyces lactucae-debilis]|uniref:DH domain-containing protein n=1 Tax=Protomyces lactucae-debilis TaxID=2754530 RepID=A0A1Y2FCI0_PROLT|nr:uncharacterized protein BCR37DRAFT_393207 [Protomyces lactucae-debilis]ORY81327.1 hypothetical protein BCR37DRAFT_393207 [Protomyces lactucae-debilis]